MTKFHFKWEAALILCVAAAITILVISPKISRSSQNSPTYSTQTETNTLSSRPFSRGSLTGSGTQEDPFLSSEAGGVWFLPQVEPDSLVAPKANGLYVGNKPGFTIVKFDTQNNGGCALRLGVRGKKNWWIASEGILDSCTERKSVSAPSLDMPPLTIPEAKPPFTQVLSNCTSTCGEGGLCKSFDVCPPVLRISTSGSNKTCGKDCVCCGMKVAPASMWRTKIF